MILTIFSVALGMLLPANAGLLRFGCAQLTVQRLDPLVNSGSNPSPHLHQIIGGVSIAGLEITQKSNLMNCTRTPSMSRWILPRATISQSSRRVQAASSLKI